MDLSEIRSIHKNTFYDQISKLFENSRKMYKLEQIYEIINCISKPKNNPNTKTQRDYYLLNTFQVLEVAGTQRLIKKLDETNEIIFVCAFEDIFDEITTCHNNVGHGGVGKMTKDLS